jgi:hypothetical protein
MLAARGRVACRSPTRGRRGRRSGRSASRARRRRVTFLLLRRGGPALSLCRGCRRRVTFLLLRRGGLRCHCVGVVDHEQRPAGGAIDRARVKPLHRRGGGRDPEGCTADAELGDDLVALADEMQHGRAERRGVEGERSRAFSTHSSGWMLVIVASLARHRDSAAQVRMGTGSPRALAVRASAR